MVSPDALPIVLGQDSMRPAAAGLDPAITLERGEDAAALGMWREGTGRDQSDTSRALMTPDRPLRGRA
jgi:hypothetical protein